MNGYLTSIVLAFSAGMLGALQGSINAQVGKAAGQYSMIIGVSLVQVIIASVILIFGGTNYLINSYRSFRSIWSLKANFFTKNWQYRCYHDWGHFLGESILRKFKSTFFK